MHDAIYICFMSSPPSPDSTSKPDEATQSELVETTATAMPLSMQPAAVHPVIPRRGYKRTGHMNREAMLRHIAAVVPTLVNADGTRFDNRDSGHSYWKQDGAYHSAESRMKRSWTCILSAMARSAMILAGETTHLLAVCWEAIPTDAGKRAPNC